MSALPDLLPDSRARETKGRIFRGSQAWVPVFCANCSRGPYGYCPEENMTFLFYQCEACARTYGQLAGTMLMPDEVFFQKLKDQQFEQCGRHLTEGELAAYVEANPSSSLATLIKEAPRGNT